jgi:hypothetical protein
LHDHEMALEVPGLAAERHLVIMQAMSESPAT